MDEFPFSTEVRVRFAETDAQGVVHNSAYLVWFEIARVEFLERFAGGYPALRASGIEAFVTEAHVRYGAAARFDDRLALHARCVDVRGARFRRARRRRLDGARVRRRANASADTRPGRARAGDRYGVGLTPSPGAEPAGGFGSAGGFVSGFGFGSGFGSGFGFGLVPNRTTRFSPT